jgi:hypothetical protein
MKQNIIDKLEEFRYNTNAIVFMTACLIIGIVMIIISVILFIFVFGQIKEMITSGGCFMLAIPLVLIVVIAIVAKKYLFNNKMPGAGFFGGG